MVIWKFKIEFTGLQQIEMPFGAKILTAQMQHGKLCIWALCEPSNEQEPRTIAICGTGHSAPSDINQYVATIQTDDGAWVWHVFAKESP